MRNNLIWNGKVNNFIFNLPTFSIRKSLEGRFLRADRWTMEQVASFRCWIALCRRFQIKAGRVLDGSVSLRYLVTQSISTPLLYDY